MARVRDFNKRAPRIDVRQSAVLVNSDGVETGVVILDVSDGEQVTAELLRRQVIVDYRPGAGIRISPHFYTADDELERTIHELTAILHSAHTH